MNTKQDAFRKTGNLYDDGNIPDVDLPKDIEPLPESTRPRKDGPGGEASASALYDDDDLSVCSARDCTGLMPTPPQTDAELESYKSLYSTEVNILDEKNS